MGWRGVRAEGGVGARLQLLKVVHQLRVFSPQQLSQHPLVDERHHHALREVPRQHAAPGERALSPVGRTCRRGPYRRWGQIREGDPPPPPLSLSPLDDG